MQAKSKPSPCIKAYRIFFDPKNGSVLLRGGFSIKFFSASSFSNTSEEVGLITISKNMTRDGVKINAEPVNKGSNASPAIGRCTPMI